MKKILLTLLGGSLFISSCKKEHLLIEEKVMAEAMEPCIPQTGNPSGLSYPAGSLVELNYSKKHCGFMPLSRMNYWVYEDSIFNDGVFSKVQYDTLRYIKTYESQPDKLIWWESNISLGIPETLYANDSALFRIEDRMFTPDIKDAKKDFAFFPGDSIKYLTSFEDAAAIGRSVKMYSPLSTPAGVFNEWILFEKKSPNFRRDQVYFRPGLGVLRYTVEKAPFGQRTILLQQISTLVAYYIE